MPTSDSSYALVQAELAMSFQANKQYSEAVQAAERALSLNSYTPHVYSTLAAAEEELKHFDRMHAAYQEGLRRFPYASMLWFNQGLSYFQEKRMPDAVASLQRCLELRPGHAGSHMVLAYIEAFQGHTSHAMLGLMTFLLIEPGSERANGALTNLEALSGATFEVLAEDRVEPFTPNDPFQELDLLINSKIALREDYKTRVKFNAKLVRQIQLLVEKFPAAGDLPATDFWNRAYAPIVEQLHKEENLTPFTYLILSSANDKSAAQWVKSNSGKIEKLFAALQPALMRMREQQLVAGSTPPRRVKGWYDDQGQLDGLGEGEVPKDGKPQFRGDWIFINDNGGVASEGKYGADGLKTGRWTLYHPNGKPAKELDYVAGKIEGAYKEFFDNGNLSVSATYRAGEPEGEAKLYYSCGALREVRQYKQGKMDGPVQETYANGQLRRKSSFRDDKKEGAEIGYYSDGATEYEYVYVAGEKQGAFTVYYPDKTVERKGTYDHDELHGAYNDYFVNGQLDETGAFAHGKRTGAWKQYYRWGKISAEKTYDAQGDLTGIYKDYDQEGRLFSELEHQEGRVVKATYYDSRSAKQIAQYPVKKSGTTPAKGYYFDGSPAFTGTYRNGRIDGEWRYLYRSGQPRSVRRLSEGKLQGVSEEYYENGQLRSRQGFASDQPQGYYQGFTRHGKVEQEGYYQEGQRQGTWRDYYADGHLSQETDYLNDDVNGLLRSYTPTGKLAGVSRYESGELMEVTAYDSVGAVHDHTLLRTDSKSYTLTYPNGKPRKTVPLSCLNAEGTTTWLLPDGQPDQVATMRLDQRNGPLTNYYENGKPRQEGQFRAGRREGEWKNWSRGGVLRSRGTYRMGEEEGSWVIYAESGKPTQEEVYFNGELNGPLRVYNYDGELLVEKRFEHGELTGFRGPGPDNQPAGEYQPVPPGGLTIKTTFANGKPAIEETYKNGYLEGPRVSYFSSGQVYRRSTYNAGQLTGLDALFYPTGKLLEEENFRYGELEGLSRYYRPDGTLERAETYRAGEQTGPTIYYDTQGHPTRTDIYWNSYLYGSK